MNQLAEEVRPFSPPSKDFTLPEPYQSGTSLYLSTTLLWVPLVCFVGALLADIAYVDNPDIQWSNFSAWLLAFGIMFLGVGIIVSILRYLVTIRRRRRPKSWLFLLVLAAAIAGLFDNFIHSHDGWTSVWPVGLTLSALTVLLLLLALVVKLSSLSNTYVVDAS